MAYAWVRIPLNELKFAYVPLPTTEQSKGGDGNDNVYSKFTASNISKSMTTSASYKYGPKYDTHIPNLNVVTMDDDGQYLLQMPMTYGKVIGYSPLLSALMAEQAVKDDDDGVVGVVDDGVGEFPIERQKEDDMALYHIL